MTAKGSEQTCATPGLRGGDNLRRGHTRQPHLQPTDVAVEVLCRRSAERLDEPAIAGVERVHILDVIAAGRDTRAWLAPDHEVFQAACRRETLVAIAAVRAEHAVARHEGVHGALHGGALAVG